MIEVITPTAHGLVSQTAVAADDTAPTATYPDCYLHVCESRSGQEWIMPLRGNSKLDLRHQIAKWVKQEFCGELELDGKLSSRVGGDYYGKLMTDGRAPDSVVCWEGAGFYLKSTY